jgi:hypothetical protein
VNSDLEAFKCPQRFAGAVELIEHDEERLQARAIHKWLQYLDAVPNQEIIQ